MSEKLKVGDIRIDSVYNNPSPGGQQAGTDHRFQGIRVTHMPTGATIEIIGANRTMHRVKKAAIEALEKLLFPWNFED